jgi:hypothetical protein
VENNNGRLVVVRNHDGKLWCGGKVLRDLSQDKEFRCRNKFSVTRRNSKEEMLNVRENIVQHTSSWQTMNDGNQLFHNKGLQDLQKKTQTMHKSKK